MNDSPQDLQPGDIVSGLEPSDLVVIQRLTYSDGKALVEGRGVRSRRPVKWTLGEDEIAGLVKIRPSDEQKHRLSQIENVLQKAALLESIARGEEIPDYAWEPVPEHFNIMAATKDLHVFADSMRMLTDAGFTIPDMFEINPKDAGEILISRDQAKLAEMVAKLKQKKGRTSKVDVPNAGGAA